MISLVMSTYNGSKYLIEQLESIRLQTRVIDEVIISDDCSTDDTFQILKDYVEKYNLLNWNVIKNEENKGWRRNFQELIKMTNGDIVFPCDQDDIWELDKVSNMTRIMEQNPNIKLLASNYTPFYEKNAQTIKLRKDEKLNDGSVCRLDNDRGFFNIMRPGCVYSFRRELIQYMDEYCSLDDEHDAFLWRIANVLGSVYIYNKSTIQFRRHLKNASRKERVTLTSRQKKILNYDKKIERLENFSRNHLLDIESKSFERIEKYRNWIDLRKSLTKNRSLRTYVKLFKYRKCYYSLKTYIADLYFFIIKVKR